MKNLIFCVLKLSLLLFLFVGCFGEGNSGTVTPRTVLISSIGNFDGFIGLDFQISREDARTVLEENGFQISAFSRNRIRAEGVFENSYVNIQLDFFENRLFEGRISNQGRISRVVGFASEGERNIFLASLIDQFGEPTHSFGSSSSWNFDNDCSLHFSSRVQHLNLYKIFFM